MRFLTKSFKNFTKYKTRKKYCTQPTYVYPNESDNYSEKPEYPPIDVIDPNSEEGIKRKWYDKIRRQLTVEEKLFEVNVQRRYGWKCFMIQEGVVPFNNLVFAQHVTKSHIIETENLPEPYSKNLDKSKTLCSEIKNDVIDALEYQLNIRRIQLTDALKPVEKEKEITRYIVTELNRILMNRLWKKESHLENIQVDYSPRIEASWKMESLVETFVRKTTVFHMPLEELPEEYLERPSDKYIQYLGHPILQLRSEHPLPQLIDKSEATIFTYSVPVYEYDPHLVLGYEMNRRHLNNIPGFWPGEEREFSFISYHDSNHIKHRPPTYGPEDIKEALHSQALFASFGWLMPLACYHGFSSYHDVTYPMTTQTVLTDGREFTFATYQLNTTELHWKDFFQNLKSNLCWVTSTKPLYETFENGKIKGYTFQKVISQHNNLLAEEFETTITGNLLYLSELICSRRHVPTEARARLSREAVRTIGGFNEDVLRTLVQFYMNTPRALENVKLKPYLGDKIKHIADYNNDEKVEWLEEKYKKCCSNTSLDIRKLPYEVQDWERIFKINFQWKPEARRRPFELRQNPYQEKLSDARDKYIPKALRPDKDLPKWKQRKYRRSFYPE